MEVEFYCSASGTNYIKEFIVGQSPKAAKKIWRQIKRLEGCNLTFLSQAGIIKKLHGYDLWEICVDFGNMCFRILFVIRNITCHLLHGFLKKSNNTPKREIETALRRTKDLDYQLSFTIS